MSRLARYMVTFAAAATTLLGFASPASASSPSYYQSQTAQATYSLPALPTPSGPAVSWTPEPDVAATPSVMTASLAGNSAGDSITAQASSPYAVWQLQYTQQVQTGWSPVYGWINSSTTTPVYGWIPVYGTVYVPTQVPVYGMVDNWVLICTRACDANGNHLPMGWTSTHPVPPGISYQGYPHVFLYTSNYQDPYMHTWNPNVNQYADVYLQLQYDDCDEDAFTNPYNPALPPAYPAPGPGFPLTNPAYKYNGQYGYGYYDECDFENTYQNQQYYGIVGYNTSYVPTTGIVGYNYGITGYTTTTTQTWGIVGWNPVYSTEYFYGYSYYQGVVSLSCTSATQGGYSTTIAATPIAYGSTQTQMTLGISNDQVSVNATGPPVTWVGATPLPAGCATSPPAVRPS